MGDGSLHISKCFSQPLYCQERRKIVSKCLPGDTQDKTKQRNREQSCALLTHGACCHISLLELSSICCGHLRKTDPETLSLQNPSILTHSYSHDN